MPLLWACIRLRNQPTSSHSSAAPGYPCDLSLLPPVIHEEQHSTSTCGKRASACPRRSHSNKIWIDQSDAWSYSLIRCCGCCSRYLTGTPDISWRYWQYQRNLTITPTTWFIKTSVACRLVSNHAMPDTTSWLLRLNLVIHKTYFWFGCIHTIKSVGHP